MNLEESSALWLFQRFIGVTRTRDLINSKTMTFTKSFTDTKMTRRIEWLTSLCQLWDKDSDGVRLHVSDWSSQYQNHHILLQTFKLKFNPWHKNFDVMYDLFNFFINLVKNWVSPILVKVEVELEFHFKSFRLFPSQPNIRILDQLNAPVALTLFCQVDKQEWAKIRFRIRLW